MKALKKTVLFLMVAPMIIAASFTHAKYHPNTTDNPYAGFVQSAG